MDLTAVGGTTSMSLLICVHTHTHTHTCSGVPQMPGQVPTWVSVCCVLTAILHAEGLEVWCYHSGHSWDTPGPPPGPFQDLRHFPRNHLPPVIASSLSPSPSVPLSSVIFFPALVDRTGLLHAFKRSLCSVGCWSPLPEQILMFRFQRHKPVLTTVHFSLISPLPLHWKIQNKNKISYKNRSLTLTESWWWFENTL